MEENSVKQLQLDECLNELGGISELKDNLIASYQEIITAEQDDDCPWMFPAVAQSLWEFNEILNAIKE